MLTIVILTHNSEKNLVELLPTLAWAERVLVLDDDSTDRTVEVAKKSGARVVQRALHNNFSKQRNFALKAVRTKWVLFVDPDERIPKKTAAEIKRVVSDPKSKPGYRIKREDIFLGKRLKFGETRNIWLTRLGQKQAGSWKRLVHEVWEIAETGRLEQPMVHSSHNTVTGFFQVLTRYARIEATYRYARGDRGSLFEWLIYPVGKLVTNLCWRWGILDGWRGVLMSLGMSWHSWLVRYFVLRKTIFRRWPKSIGLQGQLVLLASTFMMVPLGQLVRIEIPGYPAVYLFEVVMGLVLGWWLMYRLRRNIWPRRPRYWWFWVFFAGTLLMSLLVNMKNLRQDSLPAGLYLGRYLIYGMFTWSLYDTFSEVRSRAVFSRGLSYIGLVTAVLGLAQYVLMPDVRWLYLLGWDDHYYRLVGTYFDPGFIGLLILLGLIASFAHSKPRWWYGRVLMVMAILLTYARSVYVVMVVLIGLWMIQSRSVLKAIALVSGLVLLVWWLPNPGGEGVNLYRTHSVVERARSVVTGWEVFEDNPVWGVGFNAYRTVTRGEQASPLPDHPSGPDNSFVLVLATAGSVGFVAMVGYVTAVLVIARNNRIIWYSLWAILLHSLTNNTFFYAPVMWWWGMLLVEAELTSKLRD